MTRGTVDGLASAHPLGELLPGVYLEDSLAQRFTEGLDTVLAPVFVTLDCLDAYLDPRLTPPDFLPWLASWVGIELDETWPDGRQRAMVAAAARLHSDRGTHRGLVDYLKLLTGGEIELIESGGTRWSAEPGATPPGATTPGLQVIVRVSDPSSVNRARLDRAVRDARPAHLPYQVQVLPLGSRVCTSVRTLLHTHERAGVTVPSAGWNIAPAPDSGRGSTSDAWYDSSCFPQLPKRGDAHIAGRLADRLTERLGSTQVFMDVDTVEPGADFATAIAREIASCDVLIALIGPTWSSITDRRGRRRLDDPDDFVVLEIRAALERGIRVIPVLVDSAVMPDRDDLPDGLQGLARRNAVRLDHETFRSDVATLLDAVEQALSGIVARSATHADGGAVARGRPTAIPFTDLRAVLTPETSRGRKPTRHRVSVTNGGNTPVDTQLTFRDQDGELTFEPPGVGAMLRPGATVDFPVLINGPYRWFGRTERLPFSAVVTPASPQPPIMLNGTRRQTAVFPWWTPTAAVAIVVIAIALFAVLNPGTPTVPVIGPVDEATAVQELKDAGYEPDVIKVRDSNIPSELTIKTDPAGGSELKRGERVQLYISTGECGGPCPLRIPLLTPEAPVPPTRDAPLPPAPDSPPAR